VPTCVRRWKRVITSDQLQSLPGTDLLEELTHRMLTTELYVSVRSSDSTRNWFVIWNLVTTGVLFEEREMDTTQLVTDCYRPKPSVPCHQILCRRVAHIVLQSPSASSLLDPVVSCITRDFSPVSLGSSHISLQVRDASVVINTPPSLRAGLPPSRCTRKTSS
jgi:hypothetical protein